MLRTIGDSCAINSDCANAVQNSVCDTRGYCVCVSGYYGTSNGSVCQRRHVGDPCSTTSDCSSAVPNSRCGTDRTCQCDDGFAEGDNGRECVGIPLEEIPCQSTAECRAITPYTICRNGVCACDVDNGYAADNEGTTCALFTLEATECVSDWKCVQFVNVSQCLQGVCSCRRGMYPSSRTTCDTPYVTVPATSTPGMPCSSHDYCLMYIANTQCFQDSCACSQGYHARDDGLVCLRNGLGSECQTAQDCQAITGEAECIGQRCECAKDSVPDDRFDCVLGKF